MATTAVSVEIEGEERARLHLACAQAAAKALGTYDAEAWRSVEPDEYDCDGCEEPLDRAAPSAKELDARIADLEDGR